MTTVAASKHKSFPSAGESVLWYSNGGDTDMPSQTYHVRGRPKVLKSELHSTVSCVAGTQFINTSFSLPNRLPTDFINI